MGAGEQSRREEEEEVEQEEEDREQEEDQEEDGVCDMTQYMSIPFLHNLSRSLHSSPLTLLIPSPSDHPTTLLSSGKDVESFHKCICAHRYNKDYMKAQRSEKKSKILQVFLRDAFSSPLIRSKRGREEREWA